MPPLRRFAPSPSGEDTVAAGQRALLGVLPMGRATTRTCGLRLAGAFLCAALALQGCTVIAVGAATVGVAADVAVGAAKLAGKGVGAAYNAITDDKPDNSGLSITYRESDPNHPWQPGPGMSNTREPEAAAPQPAAPPAPPAPARTESLTFSP